MKIYLMRHGKTLWNQLNILQGGIDSPLLDSSIKEIDNIKNYIKKNNLSFDIICTSTSGRTINTSQLLGYESPLKLEELGEMWMGEMQGKSYDEFEKKYPEEYFNYFHNPMKYNPSMFCGEDFLSLSKRVEKIMKKLELMYSGKNILIISHGVTMQGIISYLKNKRVIIEDFKTIPLPENLKLLEFQY